MISINREKNDLTCDDYETEASDVLIFLIRRGEIVNALSKSFSGAIIRIGPICLISTSEGLPLEMDEVWHQVMNIICSSNHLPKEIRFSVSSPCNYREGISYIKEDEKSTTSYPFNFGRLVSEAIGHNTKLKFFNPACCLLAGELLLESNYKHKRIAAFTLDNSFNSALYSQKGISDANYWNYPLGDGVCNNYFSEQWFLNSYADITCRRVNCLTELLDIFENSHAKCILEAFVKNITNFIWTILKFQQLDCIILGGQFMKIWQITITDIRSQLQKLEIQIDVMVAKNELISSLIGAANLHELVI